MWDIPYILFTGLILFQLFYYILFVIICYFIFFLNKIDFKRSKNSREQNSKACQIKYILNAMKKHLKFIIIIIIKYLL